MGSGSSPESERGVAVLARYCEVIAAKRVHYRDRWRAHVRAQPSQGEVSQSARPARWVRRRSRRRTKGIRGGGCLQERRNGVAVAVPNRVQDRRLSILVQAGRLRARGHKHRDDLDMRGWTNVRRG